MKKKLLIISYSPIARDPRVMRQIHALKSEYQITVVGLAPFPQIDDAEFITVSLIPKFARKVVRALQLLSRCFESAYWQSQLVRSTENQLIGRTFDLAIANDIVAVPVALKIAAGSPVIFDGHEYSPREFENSRLWRIFLQRYMTYLCTRYLPMTSSSMTVCQGIADEYRAHFHISPIVVYNSPLYQELPVNHTSATCIRLIHHGISARSRHLECMIDMMEYLDERFTLDLMLVNSDPAYFSELQQRASNNPKIRFRNPVPMEEISKTINIYDIGLFLLPPVNFNYRFALPNKFFEFIQARLAIAIGPSPEMAALVKEWGIGIIAEDFRPQTLADNLNALSIDQIQKMKQQSAIAAEQIHSGIVTLQLRELVKTTLATAPCSYV